MKKLLATRILTSLMFLVLGVGWATQALATEGTTTTVTSVFKVEGMTCGGCEAGVRMKVKKLDGVEKVEASHEKKRARVTYDPKLVTPPRIIKAIEELGYSAELLPDKTSARARKSRGSS